MNKKLQHHILYILAYLILSAIIVLAIKHEIFAYNHWLCDGISVAEKGVTQDEIEFCTGLGRYVPRLEATLSGASFLINTGLVILSISVSIVFLFITGFKHYQFLTKK